MAANTQLTQRPAWKALQDHFQKVKSLHMRNLFADDPQRAERFSLEALGIYLDYSKNRITGETIPLLLDLAKSSGLQGRIEAMFRGDTMAIVILSTRNAGRQRLG